MKRLEFFYDFVCPYAYLASTQVRALAKPGQCRGKDAVALGVQAVPDLFPHPTTVPGTVDKNKSAAFLTGLHVISPSSLC